MSTQLLPWRSEEGKEGNFTPYVLPLPVNLWGRDVLAAMGMVLTTEYSIKAQQMMHNMGYHPGEGLGKNSNGITTPLQAEGQTDRKRLGF